MKDSNSESIQKCQDKELTARFKEFHKKLIGDIISFCKKNNVYIDEFTFSGDFVKDSIIAGKWHPSTDSYFGMREDFTDDKPFLVSV